MPDFQLFHVLFSAFSCLTAAQAQLAWLPAFWPIIPKSCALHWHFFRLLVFFHLIAHLHTLPHTHIFCTFFGFACTTNFYTFCYFFCFAFLPASLLAGFVCFFPSFFWNFFGSIFGAFPWAADAVKCFVACQRFFTTSAVQMLAK